MFRKWNEEYKPEARTCEVILEYQELVDGKDLSAKIAKAQWVSPFHSNSRVFRMGPLSKEQRSTTQVKIKGNILPNFSDIRYIPGWLFKKNYHPPLVFWVVFPGLWSGRPGHLWCTASAWFRGSAEEVTAISTSFGYPVPRRNEIEVSCFFWGGTLPIPPTNSWLEVLQWGRNLQKKWSFPFIWGSFPLNHDYGRKSSLLWLIVEMNVVYELLNVLQLPKTNSQRPLKMDGWKTILSFREGLFSRAMFV